MAVIDSEAAELASGKPWRLRQGYVGFQAWGPRDGGVRQRSNVWLHRIIADTPAGYLTDHIDGDPLNNRRANLRVVVDAQNGKNKHARSHRKTSRFKGVHRYRDGRWAAAITADYRRTHLGYFASEEEAARAYDAAARRYHGPFAALNFTHEASPPA